jgi:hypothetical protein
VVLPDGRQRPAAIATAGSRRLARFTETTQPGLYCMLLPSAYATRPTASLNRVTQLPFTVLNDPREGSRALLSEADIARLRSWIGLAVVDSQAELLAAHGGEIPGRELWKFLVIGALLTLTAETALTRWIALRRREGQ